MGGTTAPSPGLAIVDGEIYGFERNGDGWHDWTGHDATELAEKFQPLAAHLAAEPHRLARGAGRLRLRIGQALYRLGDGIHDDIEPGMEDIDSWLASGGAQVCSSVTAMRVRISSLVTFHTMKSSARLSGPS